MGLGISGTSLPNLCLHPHRLDRMSKGQMGHLRGTDGTRPQGWPQRCPAKFQRLRDDNEKKKIALLRGVGGGGSRGELSKNTLFVGKHHDNKILKVQILLSRNFVVIPPAPKIPLYLLGFCSFQELEFREGDATTWT